MGRQRLEGNAAAALFILFFLRVPLLAQEPVPREAASIASGSTIPQIAVGDNTWSTEFQVLSGKNSPQAFSLQFFDSNGNLLALDLFNELGESLGSLAVLSGVVQPAGIAIARTNNAGPLKVGYAVLDGTGVSLTAVITNAFAGQTNFRASIPGLATSNKHLRSGFTNSHGFNTCIAWKSDASSFQQITLIARDANGSELCRTASQLESGGHEAFCLPSRLSCVTGRDGALDMMADQGVTAIAFTFDPGGRFWTQIPYAISVTDVPPPPSPPAGP